MTAARFRDVPTTADMARNCWVAIPTSHARCPDCDGPLEIHTDVETFDPRADPPADELRVAPRVAMCPGCDFCREF